MALQNIGAVEQFTIETEVGKYKDIASIIEKGVLRNFKNNTATMAAFFSSKADIDERAGTGITRMAKRAAIGNKWDFDNGAERKRGLSLSTTQYMDQILAAEFMLEDFDINRWLSSTSSDITQQQIESLFDSQIMSYEGIAIRAIQDYTIAMGNKRPENIVEIDPAKITTPELARKAYLDITNVIAKLTKSVDEFNIGANKSQFKISMSIDLYNALTAYLPNFILNNETLNIMATGEMYKNSLFGVPITQHFMLANKFIHDQPSFVNNGLDFDFSNLHFIIYIDYAVGMPMGIQVAEMLKDNKTLNAKLIVKCEGFVPMLFRPKFVTIGVKTKPTAAEITAAQGKEYTSTKRGFEESFQVPSWDKGY